MTAEKKRALLAIAAATIVGGVLRLGTVGWGLPILLHVDEKGFVMWEAIATEHEGLVHDDYRPHASVYGPLVYELAIAVKWAMYGGPETARPVAAEHRTAASYHQNEFDPRAHPEAHYSLADWTRAMRTISALLGTLAILLLARAAWRLRGPTAGAIAALITALAPGLVQVGHFYTADALLVPEIAMFADACALLATGAGAGALAYAAVALALIALTKLPGVLVGLLLPFAIGWSQERVTPRTPARSLRQFLAASLSPRTFAVVLGAAAIFVLAQPWLLDGRGLPAGDGNRSGLVMLGLYFTEREFPWHDWRFTYNDQLPFLYWLITIFPYVLGGPVALLGYVGIGRAVLPDRGLRFAAVLAVPSFLLCGAWGTMTIRHGLPVVPGLVLAASFVLTAMIERASVPSRAIASLAMGWLAIYSLSWAGMFLEEDPRLLAGRWLSEHVREGDVIVTDPEAPYTAVLADDADFIGLPDFELPPRVTVRRLWSTFPADSIAYADAEGLVRDARWVVVGDFYLRRALHHSAERREPEHARFYRDLFEGRLPFVMVAHFDRRPRLGPISFDESGAEALSVDFDHMPVWIFARHAPSE